MNNKYFYVPLLILFFISCAASADKSLVEPTIVTINVDAYQNCFDLGNKRIPSIIQQNINQGNWTIRFTSTADCSGFDGCPIPNLDLAVLGYPSYAKIKYFNLSIDESVIITPAQEVTIVPFFVDSYCGDNTGGGTIEITKNQSSSNTPATLVSFIANPKSGNPPLSVTFLVTAKDSDGKIASYNWDFNGDGKVDQATKTGKLTHIYNELGTFNTSVTVVDDQGAETKSSAIPITVAYGPDLIGEVETYTFNNSTNTIHIYFKVTNQGDIPVNGFLTTFNLSNNGTSATSKFSEANTDKLAVGESKSFSVDHTFANSIYGKWLLILVDSNKEVAEVNEKNNGSRIIVQRVTTK